MNRKTAVLFGSIVLLTAMVLFFALVGRGNTVYYVPGQTAGTSGETAEQTQTGGSAVTEFAETDSTVTDASEDADEDTVSAAQGIGDRGTYPKEETAAVETDPQPQDATPPQTEEVPTQAREETAAQQSPSEITFAQYEAMTEAEQEAFVDSFESIKEFNQWWQAAQANKEDRESVEIEDGVIDLENDLR